MMMKKFIQRIVVALLIVVAIPVIAPFVGLHWSPINCRYEDIDLDTGRVRYTTMIYWLPITQKIEHTALSAELANADLNAEEGNWRRVNTFSLGQGHSPHHGFHGALNQVRQLEMIWELEEFDAKARKASARELLKLWVTTARDFGADEYLAGLSTR